MTDFQNVANLFVNVHVAIQTILAKRMRDEAFFFRYFMPLIQTKARLETITQAYWTVQNLLPVVDWLIDWLMPEKIM